MERRDQIIGGLLLLLCAVAAAILVRAIVTGVRPSLPEPLRIPVMVIGLILAVALLWRTFSRRFTKR